MTELEQDTETSTEAEKPEDNASWRDALEEAYETVEATGDETDKSDKAEASSDEAETGSTENAEALSEDTDAEEAGEDQAEEVLEAAKIDAPTYWSKKEKELFKALPEEAKQVILKKERESQAYISRRNNEIQQVERFAQGVHNALHPHLSRFQNADVAEVIQELLNADQFIAQNPTQAIINLAQSRGIDLKSLVEKQTTVGGQPAAVSPEVIRLQQELQGLRSSLQGFQQQALEQQTSGAKREIQQFREEQDAQGNLQHPHFDRVYQPMLFLINALRIEHPELSPREVLDRAYSGAVNADPELQAEIQQAQKEAQEKARSVEMQKKAMAAKKAAKTLAGSAGPSSKASAPKTWREALQAAYDEHS